MDKRNTAEPQESDKTTRKMTSLDNTDQKADGQAPNNQSLVFTSNVSTEPSHQLPNTQSGVEASEATASCVRAQETTSIQNNSHQETTLVSENLSPPNPPTCINRVSFHKLPRKSPPNKTRARKVSLGFLKQSLESLNFSHQIFPEDSHTLLRNLEEKLNNLKGTPEDATPRSDLLSLVEELGKRTTRKDLDFVLGGSKSSTKDVDSFLGESREGKSSGKDLTSLLEDTKLDKTSETDLTSLLRGHMQPEVTETQVYMCSGNQDQVQSQGQGQGHCQGQDQTKSQSQGQPLWWREMERVASFAGCRPLPAGVWVTRLTAAGFYCPHPDNPVLRCAFCQLTVDIDRFSNTSPTQLHRVLSPACPLFTGDSGNLTLQEQGGKTSSRYLHAFYAARPSENPHDNAPSLDFEEARMVSGANQLTPETELAQQGAQHTQTSGHGQQNTLNLSGLAQQNALNTPERVHQNASELAEQQNSQHSETSELAQQTALNTSEVSQQNTLNSSEPPLQDTQNAPGLGQQNVQHPPTSSQTEEHALPQSSPPSDTAQTPTNTPYPYQTARYEEPTPPTHSNPASSHAERTGNGSSAADGESSRACSNETVRQVVTYAQLGIYTQEPKRPDLVIAGTRVTTYTDWPHAQTHSPEEMAEAGFYYVGQEDLVRCFYCKGGLKSWQPSLRPWVEHARFYPQCPFVGQAKGQQFIEVVQEFKQRNGQILESAVNEELMRRQAESSGHNLKCLETNNDMLEDGACSDEGTDREEQEGARTLDASTDKSRHRGSTGDDDDNEEEGEEEEQLKQAADELENENQMIKNERTCKICQMEDVSILFLPCGHLVSCSQCAPALRTCAICRERVKGRVRVRGNVD